MTNLFSSLGYWGDDADRRAIGEFRRVLRPGGSLVIETMHRDMLMAMFGPKSWEDLPGGALMIEERAFDHERGVIVVRHELVEADGTRITAPYELRVYTATELIALRPRCRLRRGCVPRRLRGLAALAQHAARARRALSRGYAQSSRATAR